MLPIEAAKIIGFVELYFGAMPKESQERFLQSMLTYSGFDHIDAQDMFEKNGDSAELLKQALDMSRAIVTASVFAEEIREESQNCLKKRKKHRMERLNSALACMLGCGFGFLIGKFLCFLCGF